MAAIPNPVELTRALVGYDTINPPGGERECAAHLADLLDQAGFQVDTYEFADRRASVVARLPGHGGSGCLCFTGHIDVVPLGLQPWTHDPFAGEIVGDKMYGRGTSDMKAGVACFVIAALRLLETGEDRPEIVLVITAGEETGCEGAVHLAATDGALGAADAVIVAEPTANYPVIGHKGALWLRAITEGVTAHGATPEYGVNAIYKAARAIGKLEDFGFNIAPHGLLGSPSLNVSTVSGGINFNSVPDRTEISIDIRTVPGQLHDGLLTELEGYLGEDVKFERVVDVPSMATNADHPWIRDVFAMLAPTLREEPAPRGAPYFTDAAVLTPAYGGAPTVILGPGEPQMAHQTDEYCLVSNLEPAIEAYMQISRRWVDRG